MEKIRTYDHTQLRKAVRSLHDARNTVREQDISLKGRPSSALIEKQDTAVSLATEMQREHNAWLDTKFAPLLPYLQKKTKYTVEEVTAKVQREYTEGLKTAMTLQSRAAEDTFDTQDAITSYTSGFITMLRVCERFGVHPNTAIALAKKNYLLEGRKVAQLFIKHRDIQQSTIERAALYNPIDPEGLLNNYDKAVKRLSADERYQHVTPGVIELAASQHHKNPESFLDNYGKHRK